MMMGCEPASRLGLVIGNVKNLILHNVSIDGQDGERPDGKIVSPPIDDMFPFLDRAEYQANKLQ